MFCPLCNTENESEQGYCRQCGLPLSGVRLAISGRAEEALSRYKKGSGALSAGAITLLVCVLIALLNFFLSSESRNYGTLVNLLIGLVVALPLIIIGMVRVSRAEGLLKDEEFAIHQLRGQTYKPASLPSDTRRIVPLAESPSARNSVTEQTTVKLKRE